MVQDSPLTAEARDEAASAITPEKMARLRQRIGIPSLARRGGRPFNSVATEDNIRHFAHGYGDDNPLWSDPDYGRASVWGSVIGPPGFMVSVPYPYEHTEEQRAILRGDPMAGIHVFVSGAEWESWSPLKPGDHARSISTLTAVEEKRSEFAQHTVLAWSGTLYVNQGDVPIRLSKSLAIYAERGSSQERGKYKEIAHTSYDEKLLAEIDAVYEREAVRGSRPRLWQDVQVGDELPSIVRGPLLTADIIAWHIGTGYGQTGGVAASKIAFKQRRRVPRFYSRNGFGAWDSAMRCHWEDEYARELGQPAAYDYAMLRDNWVITAVTNWVGDSGWLWKFRSSTRRFNYHGDTTWISGTVADRYQADTCSAVAVELRGVNQRGETTIEAQVHVVLPTSEDQLLTLPSAPEMASRDPMDMLKPFLQT